MGPSVQQSMCAPWHSTPTLAQLALLERREPSVPQSSPGALVRSGRKELTWLPDEELAMVEFREPSMAVGLGLVSGGGGFLYTGDTKKGVAGIAAMTFAIACSVALPTIGWIGLLGVAGWGAVGAWQQSHRINRFLRNKRVADAQVAGHDPTQKLLASMPGAQNQRVAAPPSLAMAPHLQGEHDALIVRLQKLAAIAASAVINETECRDRKIDLLSEVASGLGAEETDSLLFALLPLLDAGVLTEEDLQFVKELGS